MNSNNKIPIFICHVLKANISENTSIVNQNINPPEVRDRRLNDFLAVGYAIVIRNCLAACSSNFVDDDISSLRRKVSEAELHMPERYQGQQS
jgi:hypothetical protein